MPIFLLFSINNSKVAILRQSMSLKKKNNFLSFGNSFMEWIFSSDIFGVWYNERPNAMGLSLQNGSNKADGEMLNVEAYQNVSNITTTFSAESDGLEIE